MEGLSAQVTCVWEMLNAHLAIREHASCWYLAGIFEKTSFPSNLVWVGLCFALGWWEQGTRGSEIPRKASLLQLIQVSRSVDSLEQSYDALVVLKIM